MPIEHLSHQVDAPLRRYIREAHHSRLRNPPYVHELSEVVIDGQQYPALCRGVLEQREITRSVPEFAGLDDVMPLATEPFRQAASGTSIDEKLHDSATDMAANASLAITACA